MAMGLNSRELNAQSSKTSSHKRIRNVQKSKGFLDSFFKWQIAEWYVKQLNEEDAQEFTFNAKIKLENKGAGIDLINDSAESNDEIKKFVNNVVFFKKEDVDGEETDIPEIDFRLIKECEFTKNDPNFFQKNAFEFDVESAEESEEQLLYHVKVYFKWGSSYWGDIDMQELLDGLHENCDKRHKELSQKKKKYKTSGDELYQNQQLLKSAKSTLNKDIENYEKSKQENQDSIKEENQKEKQVSENQSGLVQLQEKLKKLKIDGDNTQKEIDSAQAQLDDIKQEIKDLSGQTKDKQQLTAQSKTELEAATKKKVQTKKQLENAKNQKERQKEVVTNTENSHKLNTQTFDENGKEIVKTAVRSSNKVDAAKEQVNQNKHEIPISEIKNNGNDSLDKKTRKRQSLKQ